jgi:protein TonB
MHRFVILIALFIVCSCAAPRPTASEPATATPASAAETETAATAEPDGGDSAAVKQWQVLVIDKLKPFLLWPNKAPSDVKRASPRVRVRIDREGHVLSVTVTKSSGYDSFDTAARRVFTNVGTLPPPPSELPGNPVSFNMAVTFEQ